MDRRIKYTRMVLNESLLKSLETKPLSKITVTEICKDADVNRSTYYTHYTDPFDQFTQLKSELFKEVTTSAASVDVSQLCPEVQSYHVLRSALQSVDAQKKVFRTLLNINGDYNLQQDLVKYLGEVAFYGTKKAENEYLLLYVSNGCFGMFYHWLMADDPIDCDTLAHMMANFTKQIEF